MKEIPLTQGKVALVDDADFELVNQFKWFANFISKVWYVCRTVKSNGKSHTVYLHKFLTGFKQTDHKDGNGLNCQRENLRAATSQQNRRGKQAKREFTSSRFRGVTWDASRDLWKSQIRFKGKTVFLGRFKNEISAARCYDDAAKKFYREFAAPNFNN